MMEHRLEIAKCAQARVSEEFYRLLRAGAAKRSMELLLETELLEILAPELVRGLKGEPDGEEAALRRARFWGYLAALDRSTARAPGAAVERAAPGGAGAAAAARRAGSRQQRRARRRAAGRADVHAGARSAAAVAPRQRDRAPDPARPAPHPARPRADAGDSGQHSREFVDEALRLAEIVSRPRRPTPAWRGGRSSRRGRRRSARRISRPRSKTSRRGRRARTSASATEPYGGRGGDAAIRDRDRERDRGGDRGGYGGGQRRPRPSRRRAAARRDALRSDGPRRARRGGAQPRVAPVRPTFLGTGAFGGPWNSRTD